VTSCQRQRGDSNRVGTPGKLRQNALAAGEFRFARAAAKAEGKPRGNSACRQAEAQSAERTDLARPCHHAWQARRLVEAHKLFLYKRDEGGFEGWVEQRLSMSRATAYELLSVHEQFGGSVRLADTLPRKVLYLWPAIDALNRISRPETRGVLSDRSRRAAGATSDAPAPHLRRCGFEGPCFL
jgi:hypothetical protein